MRVFDTACERLETKINEHSIKIDTIEAKYNDAMISKFDKLIAVNSKIAKNLEKLVKRFEREERDVDEESKEEKKITNISFSNIDK
jgi:hypothetical protein